jgi:regulatory protein
LCTRLRRRGFDGEIVEAEIDRLEQLGYIDDVGFARAWVASRGGGSVPRGPLLLQAELRRKGVDAEIARSAVAAMDAEEAATAAAQQRSAALRSLPHQEFRRRLLPYLLRRGFDYEVAKVVVERAWSEPGAERGS